MKRRDIYYMWGFRFFYKSNDLEETMEKGINLKLCEMIKVTVIQLT
jgi:hypothetical protein